MNTMQNPRMQAEALKRMGRGPDTQLIHMTDSEIDALNGLSALVFNEPLRTNPQTGLPEAGLFKKLLPTVLAIGAATFLGPAAAPMFTSLGASSGLAAGLGGGLAAFGGHLAGQAITGQDIDFGRAALAGVGSGLTAGLTAPAGGEIVDAVGGGAGAGGIDPISGAVDIPMGGFETFGTAPASTVSDATLDALAAGSAQTTAVDAAPSLLTGSGPGGMRTFSEGFDYLVEEPGKRILAPLAVAGAMGEFDDPIEAPARPEREPFVPKKFRATRERRDLDRDEDGEVTEKDIMEVVQELPEGQSSRFFTPMRFTPLNAGGLVNLEQGGSIKEAIQNLTGGEGSAVLPMIAQAVVKPGEEEEDEATTKGYPLGTPGTPPGMPTTGIAIGGGQPPQPFQVGGPTALDRALGGDDAGLGVGLGSGLAGTGAAPAGPSVGVDVDGASTGPADTGGTSGSAGTGGPAGIGASPAAEAEAESEGGLSNATTGAAIGSAIGRGIGFAAGLPTLGIGSFALSAVGGLLGRSIGSRFDEPAPISEAEAATEAAAQGMAGLGMDLGDTPDESGKSTEGIATAISEAMAEVAAEESGASAGTGPAGGATGTSSGESSEGIGGTTGQDDTSDDPGGGEGGADGPDGDDSGGAAGDGPGGTGGSDDYQYGGLISLEQGGLAGIPYFEGRVMPTGDPKEDGMSDNIPFVIAGQEGGQMGMQPAILSPDEYVIPADVVSMLGNGSSTAGSNQLDQFISNFRMEKYGRPKQPPEMRGGLSSLA